MGRMVVRSQIPGHEPAADSGCRPGPFYPESSARKRPVTQKMSAASLFLHRTGGEVPLRKTPPDAPLSLAERCGGQKNLHQGGRAITSNK